MKEHIIPGKWTEEKLDLLLGEASSIADTGMRIDFISERFLRTAYGENTLIGGTGTPEEFVINLEQVDCLTFIEYVEAMRRSKTFGEFRENLKRVRYRDGMVAFRNRNHFFTDWKAFNADGIIDVTTHVSGGKQKEVSKRLNEKHDGTFFISGISCRLREVGYIRTVDIDDEVLSRLIPGDYTGIYSKKDGLDVEHVGIITHRDGAVYLRHASSVTRHRKVVDERLRDYLGSKAGIIVFRARQL